MTYWPYNVPLFTVHSMRGTERECRQSLRPNAPEPPRVPPKA